MAYVTGTATDHVDLFNKFRNFLTTNAELFAAGQAWTQEAGNMGILAVDQQITVKGPGLAGADQVYAGLELVEDIASDKFAIKFWGHAGLDLVADAHTQPIQSADHYLPIWNGSMNYWFIANGRRWICVVQVSSTWQSAHCGLLLPFSTPTEYPYPYYIAGMSRQDFTRWSDADTRHRFFAAPGNLTAQVYRVDNSWDEVGNYSTSTNTSPQRSTGWVYPARHYVINTTNFDGVTADSDETIMYGMDTCFDGSYFMRQLQVHASLPSTQIGVLDGVFWVTGRGNASGNTITKDTTDYLVVQNGQRTDFRDYMALRKD